MAIRYTFSHDQYLISILNFQINIVGMSIRRNTSSVRLCTSKIEISIAEAVRDLFTEISGKTSNSFILIKQELTNIKTPTPRDFF